MKRSAFQVFIAINSIISLIFTCYYKISTGKGLFIFNPCHVTLLGVTILLLWPENEKKIQRFHTYWTAWLSGAMMALVVPHLEGISNFEVFLYYYEHLLIFPIAPFVLLRRYGYETPTIKNQLVAFCSVCLYQLLILTPLSRISMVNLNFTLCHTPADPIFESVKHHYYFIYMFILNIFSFFGRLINYVMLYPFIGKRKVE